MSDVAVVIVSHNSGSDLDRSLPVVCASRRQVIVVDNASTDGTPLLVRERFPDVHLVELRENVGYGVASNEGIARSAAGLLLLLNPDAWPLENGIERLAACAEREPALGAVGPALQGPDGRRQRSLVRFPTRWWLGRAAITSAPSRAGILRLSGSRGDGKFLVGAALLVRREAVEQVGGFDPSFFMFGEDVDLCWRLREAGWLVALCPEASFVHVGGTSTRRNWPAMYREQLRGHLRLLAKHRGLAEAEAARKLLRRVLTVRALVAEGEQQKALRAAVRWLGSGDVTALLEEGVRPRYDGAPDRAR
jgi:N-acetylglucosaminyl-diphospho-decaprenol L-rhamnosyltransferase